MKPLRLKMYGVGPYTTAVDIDFTKLNEEGLFLITGATGTGKTSIFDGITYALYGETNFKDEDKKNGIISDYLANHEHKDAYVEFTFEVDNIEYVVKRIPSHYKYKANGERNKTKVGESFEIETETGKRIPGKKDDRDKYIKEEVLKLDASQFKQLIMLPQGAFSEFIRSNSDSKEKTLEKIFDTNIYKLITEKLKDEVKDLNVGITKEKDNIFAKLGTLNIDEERWNELLNEKILGFKELKMIIDEKKVDLNKEKLSIKDQIKQINIDKIITDLTKGEASNISVDELKKAKEKLAGLNKESESIEEKKEKLKIFKRAKDIKVEYARKVNSIEDYTIKEDEYKNSLKNFEEYKEKNNKKIENFTIINEELKVSNDRVNTLKILEEEVKNYNKLLISIEKKKNNLKKLEEEELPQKEELKNKELLKKEELKLERAKVENDIRKATELNLEQEEAKTKENTLKGIIERYEKISEEEKELEEKKRKLEELIFQEREKFTIYEEQNNLWFQSEAFNLVGKLEEGKPCPVCGSLDHPEKAEKPENVPTKEELNKYNKKYENVKNEKNKLTGKIETMKKNIEISTEELKEKLKQEELVEDYEELLKLKKDNLDRKKDIKAELKTLATSDDLEKLIEKETLNTENIEKTSKEKQNLKDKIISLKGVLEYERKDSEAIKIKLKEKDINIATFDEDYQKIIVEKKAKESEKNKVENLKKTRGNLESALQEKLKNLEGLEKKMKEAEKLFKQKLEEKGFSSEMEYLEAEKIKGNDIEKEITTHRDDLTRVRATIDEKKAYEGVELIDLKTLKEEKKLAERKIQELTSEMSKKIFEVSELDKRKKELENTEKKIGKEGEVLNIYTKLLGIAEGKYGDQKNNITFQNYVLGVYFEEVLDRANERFTKMTNNQYQMILYRKEKSGRGKAGLDINVFDTHTGRERSVKTLSGGETFKASMALALGLSDVVQAQNGGIQLDSVFIDEGFGTLDEESLSTAMDVLMELKSNGRTVGIISHVSELKQTITSQIRVEKTSRGSRVEVVF